MPNATVRANDTALPKCMNPSDDFRAELNWQRHRELEATAEHVMNSDKGTEEATEAAFKPVIAIERVLEADMDKSVQALACVLMVQIEGETPEEVDGLNRACLKAILPQLEGSIGADAERLLAQEEKEEGDATMTSTTDRRAVLGAVLAAGAAGATAVLPVNAAGVAPVLPDPVLALVAKVRAAWVRFGDALEKMGAHDDEQTLCAFEIGAFEIAMAELLETPPMTLAGARAAIAWFVEYDEPNIPKTSGRYLPTLIRSPIFAQEEARS